MTAAHAPSPQSAWRDLPALLRLEWMLARRLGPARVAMLVLPLVTASFLTLVFDFVVHAAGDVDATGLQHGIPGLTVTFSYLNLAFFCWSAYDEHGFGTWDRLRGGGTSPAVVTSAKAIFTALYLFLGFVIAGIGGWIMGMRIEGSVVAWGVIAAISSIVTAAWGVALYVWLRTANLFIILNEAGAMLMGGFAGAITPNELLPEWVRAISPVLPQYWSVRAFHGVTIDGAGLGSIGTELSILAAFAVVFCMVARAGWNPDAHKRPMSE